MLPALSGPTSTGCPPFVTLPRDPAVTTLATSWTLNGHWHGAVVAALASRRSQTVGKALTARSRSPLSARCAFVAFARHSSRVLEAQSTGMGAWAAQRPRAFEPLSGMER